MNIINTLKYEILHIVRSTYKVIAIILFMLASVYGLHNGYSLYTERQNELEIIQQKSLNMNQEALDWYASGQNGPEKRPWVNVNTPFWAMWYANHYALEHPSPLMTYSVGQAEQFAYYKRVSVWSTAFDKDLTAEISNPERIAIGNLDFSFIWLFLMPLLLIVLTYSIHGLEKDLGFMVLLSTQVSNRNVWIVRRFLAIGILATFLLLLLVLIPAVVHGFFNEYSNTILLLFGYKWSYLILWLVVLTVVAIYSKGQTNAALKMVGIWLVFTIVLPGLVHQYTTLKHPTGLMLEVIDASRDDRDEILQTEFEEVQKRVYKAFPELVKSKVAQHDSLIENTAKGGIYRAATNLHMKSVVNELLDDQMKRSNLVSSLYIINPVMAFQNRINALSGTDFYANQRYREKIQETANKINERLLIDEWNDQKVDSIRFKTYKQLTTNE